MDYFTTVPPGKPLHRLRFSLSSLLSFPYLRHLSQALVISHAFDGLAMDEIPMAPSLGLTNLLEQLTELRETLCNKFIIGDDQGYRWIARWREVWKGPKHKCFCSCGAGIPPSTGAFTNLEVLQTPCFWNFMEASPRRHCCCCCSVAKSYLTLCDPMACSTPGSSVLHSLLEFAQVHVHWVGDGIINSIFSHSPFSQPSSGSPHRVGSLEHKILLSLSLSL